VEITQAAHVRVTHVPKHHRQNKNELKMEKKLLTKSFDKQLMSGSHMFQNIIVKTKMDLK
jgi:hypothetical protein